MTVGPDHVAPENPVPTSWNTQLPEGLNAETPDTESLQHWWTRLNDSTLNSLIEQAFANNLELQTAVSRVRQARSERTISRSALFPSLNFSGSATHNDSRSKNRQMGTVETDGNLYNAGFDASWELDVFGGQRRAVEASEWSLQATQASLYDVLFR
jgi:outer membrane protein TolC